MNNVLYHHGVLGQKWGVRRYQNADGSLKYEQISNGGERNKGKAIANGILLGTANLLSFGVVRTADYYSQEKKLDQQISQKIRERK